MFKKMIRKRSKHKDEESMIKPNIELAIDDISDYRNVLKSDPDLGYKGLKKMFEERELIRLVVMKNEEERDVVEGIISHYDDSYGQLVVVSGNSLKRLVFDQIVDVHTLNGDEGNEEFSD
jgi:hypothetical protein